MVPITLQYSLFFMQWHKTVYYSVTTFVGLFNTSQIYSLTYKYYYFLSSGAKILVSHKFPISTTLTFTGDSSNVSGNVTSPSLHCKELLRLRIFWNILQPKVIRVSGITSFQIVNSRQKNHLKYCYRLPAPIERAI